MTVEELEAVSAAVGTAYFPHQLVVRHAPATAADVRAVDLGEVRLARIGWGAEVSVVSEHPGAWAVNVPKCGVLEARVHGHHVLSTNGQATICPPDTPTRMSTSPNPGEGDGRSSSFQPSGPEKSCSR